MIIAVITMCFYGLSFNSGKQDLFKGTGLMAGVEVLAYFIILFTIDIGGRRPGNFPDILSSVRSSGCLIVHLSIQVWQK